MNRLCRLGLIVAALVAASCQRRPPPAVANPHFLLGPPYQADGLWRYPQEQYDGSFTGLAVIQPANHPPLTANGELYDPDAMQAASPTLQLPAIARVTDLGTGRQVLVRIDDRGPASPGRVLAVTPRVAALLGMTGSAPARVRVQLLPAESHAVADDLPGAPHLAVAPAPRIAVTEQPLGPPGAPVPALQPAAPEAPLAPPAAPLRLPAVATQTAPEPSELYVRLSPFTSRAYAIRQAEAFGAGRAQVTQPEGALFAARLGPFATIAAADAALDRAIRAGVTDARIVVE